MTYETTPKQEQAIRDWLQEAIVPLIEQVLVKKLGQAMSFAAKEVVQPQRKPLPAHEIVTMYDESPTSDSDMIAFARAIEAAHGIKGDA